MNDHESFNVFFRSKRDQYLVEIRKHKNENALVAKRRKLMSSSSTSGRDESQAQSSSQPIDRQNVRVSRWNKLINTF